MIRFTKINGDRSAAVHCMIIVNHITAFEEVDENKTIIYTADGQSHVVYTDFDEIRQAILKWNKEN